MNAPRAADNDGILTNGIISTSRHAMNKRSVCLLVLIDDLQTDSGVNSTI